MTDLGGIPGVVVCTPEITTFQYSSDIDYILLGCDGIFDTMTNEMVNEVVWETVDFYKANKKQLGTDSNTLTQCLNDIVNNILKKSLISHSEDNVTVILVAFRNLLA